MHQERTAVLFNPAAGKGKALRLQHRVEKCLHRYEIPHDFFVTRSAENLRELAREMSPRYPTIIGAGGDSTLQIMADEMRRAGSEAALGMIGLGSSNDIAREFRVETLDKACLAIKRGVTKRIDLGCVRHGQTELLAYVGQASIGLAVWVNRYIEELAQRGRTLAKFQAAAGALGVISALRAKEISLGLKIEADSGKAVGKFSLAVFSNISFLASGRKIAPAAQPDDGKLDACLIEADTFFRLLSLARKAKKGKHAGAPGVKFLQSSSFSVSSDKPFAVQADGEVIGGWQNPTLFQSIEISVIPKALKIIVGDAL